MKPLRWPETILLISAFTAITLIYYTKRKFDVMERLQAGIYQQHEPILDRTAKYGVVKQ